MRSQLWKTYVAESHSSGEVLCGYDTRPSSVHLSEAARCGIESAHCKFHLHGMHTLRFSTFWSKKLMSY